MKSAILTSLSVALASIAVAGSASASVIYQETFTTNTGALNGRAAEGPTLASWIAATNTASVSGGLAVTGANRGAWLPFSSSSNALLTTGRIYTLDVVAKADNTGDIWGAIGFSPTAGFDSNGGSNFLVNNPNTPAWWLFRGANASPAGQTVAFKGPGAATSVSGPTVPAGFNTYTLVLNTSNSTNSLWTIEYKVNGVSYRGPETFGFAPNISYVGWGSNGAIVSIDSFTLSDNTVPVPEPTALAALGLLSATMLRRRK